jgi:hypothetical protein
MPKYADEDIRSGRSREKAGYDYTHDAPYSDFPEGGTGSPSHRGQADVAVARGTHNFPDSRPTPGEFGTPGQRRSTDAFPRPVNTNAPNGQVSARNARRPGYDFPTARSATDTGAVGTEDTRPDQYPDFPAARGRDTSQMSPSRHIVYPFPTSGTPVRGRYDEPREGPVNHALEGCRLASTARERALSRVEAAMSGKRNKTDCRYREAMPDSPDCDDCRFGHFETGSNTGTCDILAGTIDREWVCHYFDGPLHRPQVEADGEGRDDAPGIDHLEEGRGYTDLFRVPYELA